jgi:hypothetical protein
MLRLAALDADDLAVISAHMQDAVVRVGDIRHLPGRKQFALVANRFDWEESGEGLRRRAGLHFDRVMKVAARNIRRDDPDAVLSLLAIGFEPGEPPAGAVVLSFSGGGTIRLEVECIEAGLRDLGPAWAATRRPSHPE